MTDLDQDRPVPGDPLRRALVSGKWEHRTIEQFGRVAKTHQDIYSVRENDERSILLVRDGRDVMVSYFIYQNKTSSKVQLLNNLKKLVGGKREKLLRFMEANIHEWVNYVMDNAKKVIK